MKINDIQPNTHPGLQNASKEEATKEEMAMEFERMFARQLVQEMTKGLFKQDDNQGVMSSGGEMYRSHIVDTLSQALAKENKLGMGDMISRHWDPQTQKGNVPANPESETEK